MSVNPETPPVWQSDLSDTVKAMNGAFTRRRSLLAASGEGLQCRLLQSVIRKGRLLVQNKYIFPGGYAPALFEVLPEIEGARLRVTDIEVLRLHYAHALRAWRGRFMADRPRIAALYDDRFCRMREFYRAFCEAAFRHSGLVVFQQISKRVDAVPITRDCIAASEQGPAS